MENSVNQGVKKSPRLGLSNEENGRTWSRLISFIFFRLWDLGRRTADFTAEIPALNSKNALSRGVGQQVFSPVSLPVIPRATAQDTAGNSPQRLRGTGAGSPLAKQTPDLFPLKGKRTETALLSEGSNNASIESAQEYVSEQRAANQRRQTLTNNQPLAEGKESTTENSRRGPATGRVESKTVSSSLTKKAATGKTRTPVTAHITERTFYHVTEKKQ